MELNCFCGLGRSIALITKNQNILIMKLTAFFMIIGCLQLNAAGNAQTVTIKVENTPLEKVFDLVEQQTGYMFFYEKALVIATRPVSINVVNKELTSFLDLLLWDQPLKYSIKNTTISINRKTVPRTMQALKINGDLENPLIKVTGLVLGTDGKPLAGASVNRKDQKEYSISDQKGRFMIEAEMGDTLIVTFVGYETTKWKVNSTEARVLMRPSDKSMEDVEVLINTGYQKFRANEIVGSVEVIDQKMLQERVGNNILDRLQGMTTGIQFQNKTGPSKASGNPRSVLNMSIRGWNTINGPTDPLIIVDNFPYTGDIDNINPNDVESIVLLKDAAASSIWGARAGNGVIVINLKKGKFNQKTSLSFRTAISYTDKPRLSKLPLMNSADYIDQELEFLRSSLGTVQDWESMTPVIEVMRDRLAGRITPEDSARKINYLKSIDSRDQWNRYMYVNPLDQTYSLNLNGGGNNVAWNASGSYANSRGLVHEKNSRTTFDFGNTFRVSPQLEIVIAGSYVMHESKTGGPTFNSKGYQFGPGPKSLPYLQLRDEDGNAVPYATQASKKMLDTLGGGLLLDYFEYPVDDWKHDYAIGKRSSYSFRGSIRYRPVKGLSFRVEMNALNQREENQEINDEESLFTRDIINQFSQINPITKVVNRQVPLGSIVYFKNASLSSLNVRSIAEYEKRIGSLHSFRVMGGLDISKDVRRNNGSLVLGYSEDPLRHTTVDLRSTYGQLPYLSGGTLEDALGAKSLYEMKMLEERTISTLLALSYEYNNRYVFSGSLRKDGANILGVRANDRWKPLWNFGARWAVSKESFFKVKWISHLNFHSSVGISGNVDITRTSDPVGEITLGSPFPFLNVNVPPNPDLRWEKFLQVNLKLDIGLFANRVNIVLDHYIKRNRDLYGSIGADFTQSPQSTVKANVSSMNGSGWELQLRTQNIVGKFNWQSTFNWGRNRNTVKTYYNNPSAFSMTSIGDGQSIRPDLTVVYPGQPLYAINAFRTAGLDQNGKTIYLVNGKPTTNYRDMINDLSANAQNASSYKFFGTSDPTFRSSIMNYFSWKQFSLSFQLSLEFGFYVRKPTLDGEFIFGGNYHNDWTRRWKKPGDELHTTVPSWDASLGAANNSIYYYQYADVNVIRGDNIKISNVQFLYNVPVKAGKSGLKTLNLAFNVDGLGIIWRANKYGVDPGNLGYMTYNLPDKRWTMTLAAGF